TIVAPDVFMTGELRAAKPPKVNDRYAGYTFGYNRPILADRVHDILTVVAYTGLRPGTTRVYLAGFGAAGPWVMLARGLCGETVERTLADVNQFGFEQLHSDEDEMMLPGAVKYGGLPEMAAAFAPGEEVP